MNVAGKIVLVTGGASGLGAATVAMFRDHGAVAISGDLRSEDDLGKGVVTIDVGDAGSVDRAVADIMATHGRLDAVVNSAGIGMERPFLDTDVEAFDRIMRVNLRGTFLVGQAAARAMVAGGGGAIVNIGSVSGLIGNGGRSAYGASKGGVASLSTIMAAELADRNIRVNVIAPGPIETPLTLERHSPQSRRQWTDRVAMGRYGTPEEVASAALYLCSDAASYVTGHVMVVDGGFLTRGIATPEPAVA